MNDELQTLLQMSMQTTAPVSTDVSMFDEGEQFDIREKQKLWESIKDFKATEPKGMKLERIIKEKYKTGREYLAHEAIDTEIGRDNLLSMSQMPERQLVGGVGTGLDALAGFSKAVSLIPAGSKRMMDLINQIIVQRGLVKSAKKSSQKLVDAAKKEGVDYGDMISRHSTKADELRNQEGALQLSEEWLKLFGTRRAKALTETEGRLLDFLK